MSMEVHPRTPAEWLDTPLGSYVLAREQEYFDSAVADVFGFNAFQLGLPGQDFLRASRMPFKCRVGEGGSAQLRADFRELPIASNSADLVLLPHVLEFSVDPHQILREVARILMPEGHVIVTGFNPRSLWGLRRALRSGDMGYPWSGRFISLPRIKDWLKLLGCEIVGGRMSCYAPPVPQEHWLRRFEFMEAAGDRWWPIGGGVYFLQAVKRVRGMRLIMPRWQELVAPKTALAPQPHKVHRAARPPKKP